ncbi:hypothetical protein JTB14_033818 [Gonioctena quinquepunctata]|nr:hypothetical protein JTB14_033818 [Gonioctena quinquepunctata]
MHHNEVQEAVQSILKVTKRDNPFTDSKSGKKWLNFFFKSRPTLTKRKQKLFQQHEQLLPKSQSDGRRGDAEPAINDFQANHRVLQYFFKDKYKDQNSEICSVYKLCMETMEIANHDLLTNSMIDAMPIQFDEVTYLVDDQNVEMSAFENIDIHIDLANETNDFMHMEINQQGENIQKDMQFSQTESLEMLSNAQGDNVLDDSTGIDSTKNKNMQICILSEITLQVGSRETKHNPTQNFKRTTNCIIEEPGQKSLSSDASSSTTTDSFTDSPKVS